MDFFIVFAGKIGENVRHPGAAGHQGNGVIRHGKLPGGDFNLVRSCLSPFRSLARDLPRVHRVFLGCGVAKIPHACEEIESSPEDFQRRRI